MVSSDGGRPLQLTSVAAFGPAWSSDGRWIYYSSHASGDDQVWKSPSRGGQAVQMRHGGGSGPLASSDGKTLYFVRDYGAGGLWKMPVGGGPEALVLQDVFRVNYAVTDKGTYFTPHKGSDGTSSVRFISFATGAVTSIAKITKPLDVDLGVSPDGKTLLYSQVDHIGSNLLLVENFH